MPCVVAVFVPVLNKQLHYWGKWLLNNAAMTNMERDRQIPVVGQRRKGLLNDLKELGKLMKEHPIIIVATLTARAVGAILGAVAFYQGWLG